jgi:hypothetical protein
VARVPAWYEVVSSDVVMRIGVALIGVGRVSTAMSLSAGGWLLCVAAVYDGWFHWRSTPVSAPVTAAAMPAAAIGTAIRIRRL